MPEFGKKLLPESEGFDATNRKLTFYSAADDDAKPAEVPLIARLGMERQQGVFKRHSFARTLHVNDRSTHALIQRAPRLSYPPSR